MSRSPGMGKRQDRTQARASKSSGSDGRLTDITPVKRQVAADQARGRASPSGDRLYKRPLDLAILVIAHLFPPMPLVWLALWIVIPALIWLDDRGPVFYGQKRVGKNGKPFTLLKFRTMVPDADSMGPLWTLEGDTRVTRIGRFLRRTALDELPQVLSIWKGEMGLVGPRALPSGELKLVESQMPGFEQRLLMRPGLTGMSQIYNTTDDARAKAVFDLEYMARMSPWLDLKLIVISVFNTVFGRWDRRAGKARQ